MALYSAAQMNVLRTIRTRRRHWVPRTLSLLAVAWLGVVAQPCLAAAGGKDQCPHCPVEKWDFGIPEGCTFLDVRDSDHVASHSANDDLPDEQPSALSALPDGLLKSIHTFATGPPAYAVVDLPSPRLNTIHCVYLK